MKLPKNYHPDFRVPGRKPLGLVGHENEVFGGRVVAAYMPQEMPAYDFVNGVGSVTGTIVSSMAGGNRVVGLAPNSFIQFGDAFPVLDEFTILARIRRYTTTTNEGIISDLQDDNFGVGQGLSLNLRPNNDEGMLLAFGDGVAKGTAGFNIGTGWNDIAATGGIGSSFRLFKNGSEPSSYDVNDVPTSVARSVHPIRIGSYYSEWSLNGDIEYIVVLDRALTTEQVRAFHRDPYQTLKPLNPIRIPIQVSGGGGTTLNADSGTFAQTGTDASLKADRLLSAISGSYTATTDAVNLLADRIIAAATGGYTAGGQDASLLADRTVNAGAGSYTLTGQDVALLKQASLVMAAGSGAFALNTQSVQLLFNRVMPAASGSITLTGQDVTLQYVAGSTLVAGSGDFLASGGDVALVVDRKMQAATGSLTAVYDDAGLVRGYVMDATGENLTLTGQDLNLLLDRALQAGTATFTETGSPVVLLYSGVGLFPDLEGEITLVSVTPKITLQSKTPKITVH